MASFVPHRLSINRLLVNPFAIDRSQRFSVYLVADGNQFQLAKVPNYVQKHVIFRNQADQILQAIHLPGASISNQPIFLSFETNEDSFKLSNLSPINTLRQQQTPITFITQQLHENSLQSVTTIHASSSFDMQRDNSTTIRTQQSTGKTQLPSTSIYHGYTLPTHDSGTSPMHNVNDSSLDDISSLDYSTAEEADDHPSFSQTSNHNYQRFNSLSIKKRQRSRSCEHQSFMNKRIKSGSPIQDTELATTMTSFNNLHSYKNDCSLSIYLNQRIPSSTFEGFPRHISLLADTDKNQRRITSTSSPRTSTPRPLIITSATTTVPNVVRSSIFSSIKSFNQKPNSDTIVHNEDHFVKCGNCQTFPNDHIDDNLKKVDISNEEEEEENDSLLIDPNEWTIFQVGKFIGHLTNHTIAQVFLKSEIDGEALLLLTKNDLLYDMKIKLGPTINILNKIKNLRKSTKTFS
ncbi:unnamed protein product [Rotaria socialis]